MVSKNIKSLLILGISSAVILGALFWYFDKDGGESINNVDNTNTSEQGNQNGNQADSENKQANASLKDLPESLKNLTFIDKYQKEAYENALKAEGDIKKDAKDYDAYNAAGFNWKTLGDLTRKEVYYMRAIDVYVSAGEFFKDKKVYQPYTNAATVYTILKDYTKAEEMMKNAILLGSEVGELYIRLADLYQNYMNLPSQKIIDLYESALHQESYQPDVIYPAYAYYLCSIGQTQQAEDRTKIKCDSF